MNVPDDRDLEKLLADGGGEWGALYRKLSRVEPPRRLDRNVLGEAARAVRGQVPRRQRWLVGIGSAAGLVLAAGIAWHVGQEAMHQQPLAPAQEAPAANAPRRQYVPVFPLGDSAHRAAPKPDASAMPAPSPAAAPPPPAAPKARQPAQPAQEPAPQASAKLEMQKPVAPTASSPRVAPAADAAQGATPESAADANANAVATPAATEDKSRPARERVRDASPEALTRSAEIHNDMRLPPDAWIRRIQWLLDEGRDEQALESLRLLRRAHPDVELPDDLRNLQ